MPCWQHALRQAVVVAVADFGGRDRVVLVDHRDGAPLQELAYGGARIKIASALLRVLQRDQNLSGGDAVVAEHLGPGARERNLADGGGGLAVLELERPDSRDSTVRPSATAPEETTSKSRPSECSCAISCASAASHSWLSRPRPLSTRSEEPTLITMRRKSAIFGVLRDIGRAGGACAIGPPGGRILSSSFLPRIPHEIQMQKPTARPSAAPSQPCVRKRVRRAR